jgi:hypothetical protein
MDVVRRSVEEFKSLPIADFQLAVWIDRNFKGSWFKIGN